MSTGPPSGVSADDAGAEGEVERLRTHIAQLETALDSRAPIDQAMGMAMLAWRTDAAGAWQILSTLSQDTNTKIRDLAQAMADLVIDPSVDPLGPAELRAALEALRLRPADRQGAE